MNGSKSGFQTPCGAQLRAGPYTPSGRKPEKYLARMDKLRGLVLVALPLLLVGMRQTHDAAARRHARPRGARDRRRRPARRRRRPPALRHVRGLGQPGDRAGGGIRRQQHRLARHAARPGAHDPHLRVRPRRAGLERRADRCARCLGRDPRSPAAAVLRPHPATVRTGRALLRRAANPAVRPCPSARRRRPRARRRARPQRHRAAARDLAEVGRARRARGGSRAGRQRRRRALERGARRARAQPRRPAAGGHRGGAPRADLRPRQDAAVARGGAAVEPDAGGARAALERPRARARASQRPLRPAHRRAAAGRHRRAARRSCARRARRRGWRHARRSFAGPLCAA